MAKRKRPSVESRIDLMRRINQAFQARLHSPPPGKRAAATKGKKPAAKKAKKPR